MASSRSVICLNELKNDEHLNKKSRKAVYRLPPATRIWMMPSRSVEPSVSPARGGNAPRGAKELREDRRMGKRRTQKTRHANVLPRMARRFSSEDGRTDHVRQFWVLLPTEPDFGLTLPGLHHSRRGPQPGLSRGQARAIRAPPEAPPARAPVCGPAGRHARLVKGRALIASAPGPLRFQSNHFVYSLAHRS